MRCLHGTSSVIVQTAKNVGNRLIINVFSFRCIALVLQIHIFIIPFSTQKLWETINKYSQYLFSSVINLIFIYFLNNECCNTKIKYARNVFNFCCIFFVLFQKLTNFVLRRGKYVRTSKLYSIFRRLVIFSKQIW